MEGLVKKPMLNKPIFQSFDTSFFSGKKVFVTGHTGFKGSWLCLWLNELGAKVTGYALHPPTEPNLYNLCVIDKIVHSIIADIRDGEKLKEAISETKPEIVIHMAAQPLVRQSYSNPAETYSVNVMGTVHLFEAVRATGSVKAVINITTDKCYENKEDIRGYRENEPLGGFDPYSNSKACSELVTSAYRSSFFNPMDHGRHGLAVASARAGNVIGGGDWAADRLVPDCIRALLREEKIRIRNPNAVRPWQHVFEPLSGYLLLTQRLCEDGPRYAGAWNFGPHEDDARSVEWIVQRFCTRWGRKAEYEIDKGEKPHEAHYLKLDCSKSRVQLGWRPKWDLEKAIDSIIDWTVAYKEKRDLREVCLRQIREYSGTLTWV